MKFEYRVVPAPSRGEKARGVKSTVDRFALALMNAMNELGREGWEYLRAEALPCEERSGLAGTRTRTQHVLVFRRPIPAKAGVEAVAEKLRAVSDHSERAEKIESLGPVRTAADGTPERSGEAGQDPAPIAPRLGSARRAGDGAFPMLGPARKSRNDLSDD